MNLFENRNELFRMSGKIVQRWCLSLYRWHMKKGRETEIVHKAQLRFLPFNNE